LELAEKAICCSFVRSRPNYTLAKKYATALSADVSSFDMDHLAELKKEMTTEQALEAEKVDSITS